MLASPLAAVDDIHDPVDIKGQRRPSMEEDRPSKLDTVASTSAARKRSLSREREKRLKGKEKEKDKEREAREKDRDKERSRDREREQQHHQLQQREREKQQQQQQQQGKKDRVEPRKQPSLGESSAQSQSSPSSAASSSSSSSSPPVLSPPHPAYFTPSEPSAQPKLDFGALQDMSEEEQVAALMYLTAQETAGALFDEALLHQSLQQEQETGHLPVDQADALEEEEEEEEGREEEVDLKKREPKEEKEEEEGPGPELDEFSAIVQGDRGFGGEEDDDDDYDEEAELLRAIELSKGEGDTVSDEPGFLSRPPAADAQEGQDATQRSFGSFLLGLARAMRPAGESSGEPSGSGSHGRHRQSRIHPRLPQDEDEDEANTTDEDDSDNGFHSGDSSYGGQEEEEGRWDEEEEGEGGESSGSRRHHRRRGQGTGPPVTGGQQQQAPTRRTLASLFGLSDQQPDIENPYGDRVDHDHHMFPQEQEQEQPGDGEGGGEDHPAPEEDAATLEEAMSILERITTGDAEAEDFFQLLTMRRQRARSSRREKRQPAPAQHRHSATGDVVRLNDLSKEPSDDSRPLSPSQLRALFVQRLVLGSMNEL